MGDAWYVGGATVYEVAGAVTAYEVGAAYEVVCGRAYEFGRAYEVAGDLAEYMAAVGAAYDVGAPYVRSKALDVA